MAMTRRSFGSSLTGSTMVLLLQGCGGGGGYSSGGASAGGTSSVCGAGAGDISGNHGHVLTILKADLDSPTDRTFALGLSIDGHSHNVSFTVAQLAALKAGGSVAVTSTITVAAAAYGGTHDHIVTATVMIASCL